MRINAQLFPHAHLVPRDPINNVRWRRYVHELASADAVYRKGLLQMCAEDPLFFVLTFMWLLEPRILKTERHNRIHRMPPTIPFCLWDIQVHTFEQIYESFGLEDAAIVKSRAVGASWLVLALFLWAWLFRPETHLGLVSATEEKVDSADDPDSLMSKLDYVLERLPSWIIDTKDYNRRTSNHSLSNNKNGSTITGYAATGDVARGGRKTAFMFDEMHSFKQGEDSLAMDSTQHVSPCRIFISTPSRRRGQSGTFFEIVDGARNGTNSTKLIEIQWWKVPRQRRGLYRWPKNKKLELLDPDYEYPKDYNFIRDGKLRSPWFDDEWVRGGSTPQKIAAELELDFGATGSTFYGEEARHACELSLKDPIKQGYFSYDPETYQAQFHTTDASGDVKIWELPQDNGIYVLGADIAAGTGGTRSNNSAYVIWNKRTGNMVASFKSHSIKPEPFADMCKAVGQFYNNAQLCPEVNGPLGTTFMNRILEIGYPSLWYRRVKDIGYKKYTLKPGYWNTDKGEEILQRLVGAIERGECHMFDKSVHNELKCYAYVDGKLEHVKSKASEDEADKGKSHGDIAIAAAVGWWCAADTPAPAVKKPQGKVPPVDSIAGRRRRAAAIIQFGSQKSKWGY